MKRQQQTKKRKIHRTYEIKPKGAKNLSPKNLYEVLKDFYTELEKNDDRNYEPESLGLKSTSQYRHLKNKGRFRNRTKFGKSI